MWTFFQVLESKVMNFTMPQILHDFRGCQPWKLTLAPSRNEPFSHLNIVWIGPPKKERIPFQSTIFCKCQRVSCCGRNLHWWLGENVFFHEDHLFRVSLKLKPKNSPPNIRRWNYLAIWRLNQFRLKSWNDMSKVICEKIVDCQKIDHGTSGWNLDLEWI